MKAKELFIDPRATLANLHKIRNLILDTPQGVFDMETFNSDVFNIQNWLSKKGGCFSTLEVSDFIIDTAQTCGTVGCVIGNAIQLDMPLMGNIISHWETKSKTHINPWAAWIVEYLGVVQPDDAVSWVVKDAWLFLWFYLFGAEWSHIDNTPAGAVARMDNLINNWDYDDFENSLKVLYNHIYELYAKVMHENNTEIWGEFNLKTMLDRGETMLNDIIEGTEGPYYTL